MSDRNARRLFAVIPAAGRSRRMGVAKLLLPVRRRTVIARLLHALDHPGITVRVVVCRRNDEALRAELAGTNSIPITPDVDPPDMRTSVEIGLQAIRERFAPAPTDGWLLSPADLPVLSCELVDRLVAHWRACDADVLLPCCEGRRGHPTCFRWPLAAALSELPPDAGVNALVHCSERLQELEVADRSVLFDLDTPADYERLIGDPGDGEV